MEGDEMQPEPEEVEIINDKTRIVIVFAGDGRHYPSIPLEPADVPRAWVEDLAFTGKGFTLLVSMPAAIFLPKDSILEIKFGDIGTIEKPGNGSFLI